MPPSFMVDQRHIADRSSAQRQSLPLLLAEAAETLAMVAHHKAHMIRVQMQLSFRLAEVAGVSAVVTQHRWQEFRQW